MGGTVVIGAGVSGLAAAFDLARAGRAVTVFERAPRAGGVVGTFESHGFRFEHGPNTVPASAGAFRALCGELGIAERLIASRPEAAIRYVFHAGALRPVPTSPKALLGSPLLSLGGKLRALSEPLRTHRALAASDAEPTLEAFLIARLGREAALRLGGAFVRGVYAAELGELGARSAFPRMWDLAQEHGSLVRGAMARRKRKAPSEPLPGPAVKRTDLLSFPEGLGELPAAMARDLGSRLHTGVAVERVDPLGGSFEVTLSSGERQQADDVVLAVPAPATSRLLGETLSANARATLTGIDHAAVTLCHLGLRAPQLPPGFGFLVPPTETSDRAPRALGILFPSNIFDGRAPRGDATLSCFYRTSEVEGLDDAALAQLVLDDLVRAGATDAKPEIATCHRQNWSGVIPRYAVGHAERMREVLAELGATHPGLHLAGSFRRRRLRRRLHRHGSSRGARRAGPRARGGRSLMAIIQALLVVLPTAYLLSAVLFGMAFAGDRQPPWVRVRPVVFGVTLALHLLLFAAYWIAAGGFPIVTTWLVVSSIAFVTALLFACITTRGQQDTVGAVVLGLVTLLQLAASSFAPVTSPEVEPGVALYRLVHVLTNVVAAASLLLSGTYGFVHLLLFRQMRRHSFGALFRELPDLELLARTTRRAALVGFLFLAIGVNLGIWMGHTLREGGLRYADPHVVLTIALWLHFGVIAFSRQIRGLTARRTSVAAVAGLVTVLVTLLITLVPSLTSHSLD